jgi:hypothetical protein
MESCSNLSRGKSTVFRLRLSAALSLRIASASPPIRRTHPYVRSGQTRAVSVRALVLFAGLALFLRLRVCRSQFRGRPLGGASEQQQRAHPAALCALHGRLAAPVSVLRIGPGFQQQRDDFSLQALRIRRSTTAPAGILHSQMQGRGSTLVFELERCTFAKKRIDGRETSLTNGSVQRRNAAFVQRIWIGACADQ